MSKERLKNGAVLLGELWRANERCASGWAITMGSITDDVNTEEAVETWACRCPEKNKFCKAKTHWLKLAVLDLREPKGGEYGLAAMMTAQEWNLTKLTYSVDIPDLGVIGIGPKGVVDAVGFAKLHETPDCRAAILRLLKVFKGAKIEAALDTDGTVLAGAIPSELRHVYSAPEA